MSDVAGVIATPTPVAAPPVAPAAAVPVAAATTAPAVTQPVAPAQAQPAPAAPAAAEPAKEPTLLEPLIGGKDPAAEPAKPAETPIDSSPAYDLKLPEGIDVDPPMMAKATDIFAKGKVTPAVAQELVSLYGEQLQTAAKAMRVQQVETWNDTIRGWQKEIMADPVIGGDKFPAAKKAVEDGLKTFFGVTQTTPPDAPEAQQHAAFIAALGIGGAGSNPAIFRFIHKVAVPRSEGGPVQGQGPAAQGKSYAERLYGNPPKIAAE